MTFAQVCGNNIVLWLIVILIYNLDGITMASILNNIQDGRDITSGLTNNSSKKISKFTAAKEYLGMLAAADNPTPAGRAASFISFVGTVTGKMHVEFEIICQRLRRRVLESVARERYGDEAVRIIRMLLDNGKMGGDQVKLSLDICYIGPDIHKLSHNSLDR